MPGFFQILPTSSAPSFLATVSSTGDVYKLESTIRQWSGPTNRAVSITGFIDIDTWIHFGTTAATDLPSTATSHFLLMPAAYVFPISGKVTGISLRNSTLGSTLIVTLGVLV